MEREKVKKYRAEWVVKKEEKSKRPVNEKYVRKDEGEADM